MADTPEDILNRTILAATYKFPIQPVRHWRLVLRRAWSVRFIAVLGFACGLNAIWPALGDILPPWAFNLGGFTLAILAFVSVFVQQRGFPQTKAHQDADQAPAGEQQPEPSP
jgi:membrane protein implicated in regulation of membrane protease activity